MDRALCTLALMSELSPPKTPASSVTRNESLLITPSRQLPDDERVCWSTKREMASNRPVTRAATAPPCVPRWTRHFCSPLPLLVTYKEKLEDCHKALLETTRYYNAAQLSKTFIEQAFIGSVKIGEGSFGSVLRCTSRDDGRDYAIKVSIEPFRSRREREQKLTEVEKYELLPPHPNLISFVKAWEEKGRLYIQTELCEESLASYISRVHDVPSSLIWHIFLDLLEAVDVLHQKDIIHMDIKPENILLTSDMVCKLGDFGLMQHVQEETENAQLLYDEGDSKYLAPEVLNNVPTKAADVFSIGVTLFEVMTDAFLPSNGATWQNLRDGNLPDKMMNAMRNADSLLTDYVMQMLSLMPAERPTIITLRETFADRLQERRREIKLKEWCRKFKILWQVVMLYVYVVFYCICTPFLHAKNFIVNAHADVVTQLASMPTTPVGSSPLLQAASPKSPTFYRSNTPPFEDDEFDAYQKQNTDTPDSTSPRGEVNDSELQSSSNERTDEEKRDEGEMLRCLTKLFDRQHSLYDRQFEAGDAMDMVEFCNGDSDEEFESFVTRSMPVHGAFGVRQRVPLRDRKNFKRKPLPVLRFEDDDDEPSPQLHCSSTEQNSCKKTPLYDMDARFGLH